MITENKDRINIKDLVVDEPEKSRGIHLYGETYISNKELEDLQKMFRGESINRYSLVAKIVFIKPDLRDLFVDNRDVFNIGNLYTKQPELYDYCAGILIPKMKIERSAHYIQDQASKLRIFSLANFREPRALHTLTRFKIVNPNEDLRLNQSHFEFLKNKMEQESEYQSLFMAADIRVLYPEEFKQIAISQAQMNMWEDLAKKLHADRPFGYLESIIHTLYALKIVKAKEISFSQKGTLDVVDPDPKPNFVTNIPLPEARKY